MNPVRDFKGERVLITGMGNKEKIYSGKKVDYGYPRQPIPYDKPTGYISNGVKKGFTLVELLVGVTIFAIVAACVYTSLYLGIKVFKSEENQDLKLQEAILTLDQMAQRIRSSFINPENEEIRFMGTEDRLDFFSVSTNGDLERMVFYLEPAQEDGLFFLYQSRCKYTELGDETLTKVELIHSKVRGLKFSYFNKKDKIWHADWPDELRLPELVKLEVGFNRQNKKEDTVNLAKYVYPMCSQQIDFSQDEES